MILFKLIEIDIDAERKRIAKAKFNKRQCKALTTLVNLFEKGEFQACLDHINNDKNFPRHPVKGYSEREHISIQISNALHDMAYENYYTQDDLLKQAKEKLSNQS